MPVRIYLPATFPVLRSLRDAGALGPAPLLAFAVTPALRESYATGDLDEMEYAASGDAARFALWLLDADPDAPRRRVVVAADVSDTAVAQRPDRGRASVEVTEVVALRQVAALLVDDRDAQPAVAAAAAALAAADVGDVDAAFIVDSAEGFELMWFATQELDHLLAEQDRGAGTAKAAP